MRKLIKHSDTEGFFNAVKKIKNEFDHHQENLNNINLFGTVKVHGANFGVTLWKNDTIQYQTRESIACPIHNNFENFKSLFIDLIGEDKLTSWLKPHLGDADGIVMYGELFGKGIQSKVGVSLLDRSYMLFTLAKIYFKTYQEDVYGFMNKEKVLIHKKGDQYTEKVYLPISLIDSQHDLRFYKSTDFKTFNSVLDFSDVQGTYDKLMDLTLEVEENCPVATSICKDLSSTMGEGIVWQGQYSLNGKEKTIIFKTKGEKHKRGSGSVKVKQEDNYTDEQKLALSNFYKEALTVDRLEQAFEYLNQIGKPFIMESIGDYLKWLVLDVQKECSLLFEETLEPLGFEFKKVLKTVNKNGADYFKNKLENSL